MKWGGPVRDSTTWWRIDGVFSFVARDSVERCGSAKLKIGWRQERNPFSVYFNRVQTFTEGRVVTCNSCLCLVVNNNACEWIHKVDRFTVYVILTLFIPGFSFCCPTTEYFLYTDRVSYRLHKQYFPLKCLYTWISVGIPLIFWSQGSITSQAAGRVTALGPQTLRYTDVPRYALPILF